MANVLIYCIGIIFERNLSFLYILLKAMQYSNGKEKEEEEDIKVKHLNV